MTTTEAPHAGSPPATAAAARTGAGGQSGTLTGTWRLARFVLRRERLRLPVWIVSITSIVLVNAVSIIDLYPTRADLDLAAETGRGNAALIALLGPDVGLDTLGGQVVWNIGATGYVIVALMAMFLVGRHTRGDEEAGRTELLRATVLGRSAPVTAVLLVAVAACAVLGALIALSLMSQGLPAAGSAAYGAAMGGFGLLFAGVTAVTAQVTAHNRTALGVAGVALGASYVVRAIGDLGSGTLSWLSPMGWPMAARPFADERPWALLLPVAGTVVLVAVADALLAVRDLGGGLVPTRPGPPAASRWLRRPLVLAVRLQRATVLGWAVGLLLIGASYGSVGNDIGDLVGDNDAIDDILAQGAGSLTDSFFATALLFLALITSGFAVSSVLRLRGEETGGQAEVLLATATSRARWATSHLTVALTGSALVMVLGGLGMGVAYAVVDGRVEQVGRLTGAALAFVPALWVVVGFTFAVFGLLPRSTAAAWAALGLFVTIGLFGQLIGLPGWLTGVSPFEHVPRVPVEDLTVTTMLALVAVSAALLAAGYAGLRHRDAGY